MATKPRRRPTAANPVDPRLLVKIWLRLDKRNREQLMTAAFGMFTAQVGDVEGGRRMDGSPVPKPLLKLLFRSGAQNTLCKVMLCGPDESLDLGASLRSRAVGRYQRPMRWMVNGNLIAPDWRVVRS